MASPKDASPRVVGALDTFDVQFEEHLPAILNALETDNQGHRLVLEWPSISAKSTVRTVHDGHVHEGLFLRPER